MTACRPQWGAHHSRLPWLLSRAMHCVTPPRPPAVPGAAISDAALASLQCCSLLEVLDISGSGITTAGLSSLAGAPAGASLQLLGSDSCRSLERSTRQAAAAGWPQLRQHLTASRAKR